MGIIDRFRGALGAFTGRSKIGALQGGLIFNLNKFGVDSARSKELISQIASTAWNMPVISDFFRIMGFTLDDYETMYRAAVTACPDILIENRNLIATYLLIDNCHNFGPGLQAIAKAMNETPQDKRQQGLSMLITQTTIDAAKLLPISRIGKSRIQYRSTNLLGDKMGKLIRYLDGKTGCWSRVNLENGDPIWISVAQAGVIVKKSRMGLMGAKLYNETNVYNAAKTVQALDAQISEYVIPSEMTNPVLRAFTQVALECKSAAQLSVRLNRTLEDEGTSDSISEENKKKAKMREQIISEYGNYIENHPPVGEIRDVSELPYSKEQILDAITLEIVRENNDQRVETMKACAIILADFQENVGPKPLTMLGISTSEMLAVGTSNASDLKDLAAKITENPDKEKYEELRKVADEELINIQSKLMAAEELRRQMPEAKKRQILG